MMTLYWRVSLVDMETWELTREWEGSTTAADWATCAGGAMGGISAMMHGQYTDGDLHRLAVDAMFSRQPLDQGPIHSAGRVHQVLEIQQLDDPLLDLLAEAALRPDDPRCR